MKKASAQIHKRTGNFSISFCLLYNFSSQREVPSAKKLHWIKLKYLDIVRELMAVRIWAWQRFDSVLSRPGCWTEGAGEAAEIECPEEVKNEMAGHILKYLYLII